MTRHWWFTSVYLAGKNQEDFVFRPTRTKSSHDAVSTEKTGHGGAHLSFQLLREV
jgi:hypothetical protein